MSNRERYLKSEIVHKRDHYEVYVNGEFVCSADTAMEAVKDLEEHLDKARDVAV